MKLIIRYDRFHLSEPGKHVFRDDECLVLIHDDRLQMEASNTDNGLAG